jgi:hypothetical protein
MQRLSYLLVFVISVVLSVAMGLVPVHSSTVFLSPVGFEPMKQWSGIHLGIRPGADWSDAMYARIAGDRGGTWPDTIVLMSDQFYNVVRDPNTHRITQVTTGRPATLSYLQSATAPRRGVALIIRIQPSPGNFLQNRSAFHHLVLNAIDYTHGDGDCRNWEDNCHRSPDYIADHIVAIHNYNAANGIAEWGFEPANEPNLEWYDNPARGNDTSPDQSDGATWSEMDLYFQAIYNNVHGRDANIRVLTPPMAQGQYAEGADTLHPPACASQLVDGINKGYDLMGATYGVARSAVSWHNYWRLGYEGLNGCAMGGQHVSYYFPNWLKVGLEGSNRTVEGFITEADLLSYPQQDQSQPIQDKDENNGLSAAASIGQFMWYELRSYHMASWLLNDLTGNSEYGWHEAYRDSAPDSQVERPWFSAWWSSSEVWGSTYLPLVLNNG